MGKKPLCNCLAHSSRPSPGLQPATRTVAGFRYAVRRAAFTSARTLPPPRRVGLRLPTPVGHGRGLAARPGYAVPGEGIDSARRRLHRFRRGGSPRPSRFRFHLRSSMPEERRWSNGFCTIHRRQPVRLRSVADPDHAFASRNYNKLQRKAATARNSW